MKASICRSTQIHHTKMKYSVTFILFIISQCETTKLVCQLFNENTKLLQQYCEHFKGRIPENCTREIDPVDPVQVEQLKIGGCSEFIVLDAVEKFKDIRTFDISFSAFRSLDWLDDSSFKLERLKTFNASHNEITSITMLFQHTPHVTDIDLSHNKLVNINTMTLGRVDKLVRIQLSHNAIKDIEDDTFANSTSLEYIDLNDNHLWSIPVFRNNKHLKIMRIERNQISDFNYCIYTKMRSVSIYFTLKSITSFYRGENCAGKNLMPLHVVRDTKDEGVFVTFDGNYEIHCNEESFQHLYTFIAGHNLYINVFDLLHFFGPSIMKLDLSGNFIGRLHPMAFDRFNYLTTLILSHTNLTDFDIVVLKNQSDQLLSLDISHNNLKYIKNVSLVKNFGLLLELFAAGNQLENAPELIQHLQSSIQKLDLSGNFVGKLNATTFQRFNALKSLNLSKTDLSVSDSHPFKILTDLQTLDISYNNLRDVNFAELSTILNKLHKFYAVKSAITNASEIFQHLGQSLDELDLSGNFIGSINVRAFQHLGNLVHLNLSHTNLIHFDFGTLQHKSYLRVIDMSHNKLREIDFALLWSNLKHLYLEGNDLIKVENLDTAHFPLLQSVSISRNQLSCDYVKQLIADWKYLMFIGDSLDQKHEWCGSKSQTLSDLLNGAYNRIKFW